jgi:hypothetical protein
MRLSIARLIHEVMLPVTLVAFMSACHKWSTVEPGQPFAEEGTEEVRFTGIRGQRVVLKQAVVVGDSVVGLVNGDSERRHVSCDQLLPSDPGSMLSTAARLSRAARGQGTSVSRPLRFDSSPAC